MAQKNKKMRIDRLKTAPLLGAAYYPESWDESEQDEDIAKMKEAGMTVMRIGEFAWHAMEPHEGDYCFDWLHRVVDKLGKAGISTVLGTPSSTPPLWLTEKDPTMMRQDENGVAVQHGTRRFACSANPTYVTYSLRIAEKMAREFGHDENVIGWQIDNEVSVYFNGCYCEHCRRNFTTYLKDRYGTVENLNALWDNELWSQAYDTFEQIPAPAGEVWHNPHLKYEWHNFQCEQHIDFIRRQAEVLHELTDAPVGTDTMPVFDIDYEKINSFVDVIQFNQYFREDEIDQAAYWFDYVRPMKELPFWNTETGCSWNGSLYPLAPMRPDGFCRMNSWLSVVLGGNACLYWLWRQHRGGHELFHGSVLYASGKPLHVFPEIQAVSDGYQKAGAFLENTRIVTDTAMILSGHSQRLLQFQPVEPPEERRETAPRGMFLHKALNGAGIRPDLLMPSADLSKYKLIFTPYLLTLEEYDLQDRLTQWVKDGGVWVAGPLTDIRTSIGAHYTDRETGILEAFTGCELKYQVPAQNPLHIKTEDGKPFPTAGFLQLFAPDGDAESLATVTGGYPGMEGTSPVIRKKIGKGWVILLGTRLNAEQSRWLVDIAADTANVKGFGIEGGVVAAPRVGDSFCGITAQEIEGKDGVLTFDGIAEDLLTGELCRGEARFAPYQTRVLQYKKED